MSIGEASGATGAIARARRWAPSDVFLVPGYRPLLVCSWLWHTTRWGGLFSCSYLVTTLSDAPILNQLVGTSIFAPMLLGGLVAGALSDRFDRRRIVQLTQAALVPVSIVMFVVVQAGVVRVWMVYPFMLALGAGGVVHMTAHRALTYETVGPTLAPRALTLETVAMASSNMAGALIGGTTIGLVGIGAAFALLAVALCASATLLARVPAPPHAAPAATQRPFREQVAAGLGLVRRSPSLASMLGVTVVMNLFCFGFTPLVPVVAEDFGADAVGTGLLAAGAGIGQLLAGIVLATRRVTRPGVVYAVGSATALSGVALFSSAPALALAFLALFVAGSGQGGFGSTQSLLAMQSSDSAERGAALGVLSTAIGALPLGTLTIGLGAQWLGAADALLVSSLTGIASLGLWLRRRPEVLASGVDVDAG